MRVLITGGTGFLGYHLCRRMEAEGDDVRIFSRRPLPPALGAKSTVEWVQGDVTDAACIERAVEDRECVIHAAALANSSSSSQDAAPMMRVNVEGTRNVARACRKHGVGRLVHVSSVAAVGIPADPRFPANEELPFNLENSGLAYYVSKRLAEKEVLAQVAEGLDAVIVNPSVICGPANEKYRVAPPVERTRKNWVIPYAPGGLCVVHVSDVVDGILLGLRRGRTGERYILGGENVSFRRMSEIACRQLALTRLLVPVPGLFAEAGGRAMNWLRGIIGARPLPAYGRRFCHQFYDSTKAGVELGYTPRPFASIVEEFAAYSPGQAARVDRAQ